MINLINLLFTFSLINCFIAQNDLKIKEFKSPEWKDSTKMSITIQNKGNEIQDTIWLIISDADLTISEAKKVGVYNKNIK